MKKIPYPDKPILKPIDARKHIEQLVFNTMAWLKIDGYTFVVYLPNEEGHTPYPNASASINVEYPYKKFRVSLQEDSLKKMYGGKLTDPLWENLEECIFHEILHVVMWKIVNIAQMRYTSEREITDIDEETVDQLTHIIYPLVKESREKSRKK